MNCFRMLAVCRLLSLHCERPIGKWSYSFLKSPVAIRRVSFQAKLPWEIDTNVVKDVVLYNHENRRFHRLLNFFGLAQFTFWICLAEFSMSTLKDLPVKKEELEKAQDVAWFRKINLGDSKFRNSVSVLCFAVGESSQLDTPSLSSELFPIDIVGCLFLGGSWFYSLKSVKAVSNQ